MPLKAVLFDMDGVIVDTEPLHRKAYYKMFDDLGISVDEDLYTSFTGSSTKKVCETLVGTFSLEETHEQLAARKRSYFKHYFDNSPDFDLLPGVFDLIQHYHQNDITLILASSAHINTINWVFDKFNLHPYFKAKISGAELKESKPHPEIFVRAAELAETPIRQCLVIEDSTNGIAAAHAAGIFCAAYKSPHSLGQNYEKANIIVEQFEELNLDKINAYFE